MSILRSVSWPSRNEFIMSQGKIALVLLVAYIGNNWPNTYPRNDNHNPTMFWIMNAFLAVATIATWTRKENPSRITFLSRPQTEEWKGWMQWAFILYHYYRVYYVYNEIRVFVSAYVWMTGFGNFMYFDKKRDFSIERIVSMVIRINYFPLLLCFFLTVPLELYYVVPLHTVGFFMTMATCYVANFLEKHRGWNHQKSCITAIALSLLVHIGFYETPAVDSLLYVSKEIHFRFQADKYSAWIGLLSGYGMTKVNEYMQWAYLGETENFKAKWCQRIGGVGLIAIWYYFFGSIQDKYVYNPIHPFIFFIPVFGYLMIRNSSRYLTECHSTALEFFGKNTLETYVLQFHVYMCKNVQHIPIVIPGSGPDGEALVKFANMILCGVVFVSLAVLARKITISTQLSVVELVKEVRKGCGAKDKDVDQEVEVKSLLKAENGGEVEMSDKKDTNTKE